MASKSKLKSRRPTTAGTGVGGEETFSTRKRIQDVLGQARAALRQSQQFRWTTADKGNNNLSSRLAFQQPEQEDYWSSKNAGEVIMAEVVDPMYDGPRPHSKSAGKTKSFYNQDNDFGLPFRHEQSKSTRPKLLGSTREQQKKEIQRSQKKETDASSDITSVSTSTAELKATSDSEESSSSGASVSTLRRRATSKVSRVSTKEIEVLEPPKHHPPPAAPTPTSTSQMTMTAAAVTIVPSPMKLTPLVSRRPGQMQGGEDDLDSVVDDEGGGGHVKPAQVTVRLDDMGFSRVALKKAVDDPLWFEKALMVRGEPISEAAYKAFKKAHEIQEDLSKSSQAFPRVKPPKRFPKIPPSLGTVAPSPITSKEPEFTADWLSDTGSYTSDVEVPHSSLAEDVSAPNLLSLPVDSTLLLSSSTIPDFKVEDDDKRMIDEANLESVVRTATELEASGVLQEIASNLQNVLDMPEKPTTVEDFGRMSTEEKSFDTLWITLIEGKAVAVGKEMNSPHD